MNLLRRTKQLYAAGSWKHRGRQGDRHYKVRRVYRTTYVKEIKDHISENQMVKVKILNIGEDGKVSLSIKRAMDNPSPAQPRKNNFQRSDFRDFSRSRKSEPQSFEDMMNKFKQTSDEKMYDLKKFMDGKRGSSGRRGGGQNR